MLSLNLFGKVLFVEAFERFQHYNKPHAWQYDIRLSNLEEDLAEAGLTEEEAAQLTVKDFEFGQFTKESADYPTLFLEVKKFIERHEWLGKLSNYPTNYFTARYRGKLAGVVVMDMPTSFSKLVGDNTREIERLISRGACVSYSPKGLASSLIMYGIRWMVKNTRFRVFTAYSDPEAKELGTIYQACNFIYLGQSSGTSHKYRLPGTNKWVSDRYFRSRSAYKRYAKELGIEWDNAWQKGDRIIWDNVPDDIEEALRRKSREMYEICEKREVPAKHKYVYILGKDKRETKELLRKFHELNPNLPKEYPKVR